MLLSMVLNSSSPSLCHPLCSWLVSGRAARPCRTAGWKRQYGAWKGHRAWRWRTYGLAGWQQGRGLSGFVHGRGVAWERECSHMGVCAYACESVHVCLTTYGCTFKHMCTYSYVYLCAWLRWLCDYISVRICSCVCVRLSFVYIFVFTSRGGCVYLCVGFYGYVGMGGCQYMCVYNCVCAYTCVRVCEYMYSRALDCRAGCLSFTLDRWSG